MGREPIRAWYCRGKKKTGRPVEVQFPGKDVKDSTGFSRQGCMKVSMKYGNAHSRARKSGATTVLEVYDLPPDQCYRGTR